MNSTRSKRRFVRRGLSVFLFLAFLAALPARAQLAGANLSGVVMDTSGRSVPNATVSIKNVATGVTREVQTNSDGLYSAPNLLPGSYDVTISAKGFQNVVQHAVTLTVGAQQSLNISLKVGSFNQTVEVTAAPPDIQTTTST